MTVQKTRELRTCINLFSNERQITPTCEEISNGKLAEILELFQFITTKSRVLIGEFSNHLACAFYLPNPASAISEVR